MRTTIIIICLGLFTSFSARAQERRATQPANDRHHCIMADDATWKKLDLDNEQLSRVKELQTSCKADYDAAGSGDKAASVTRHEAKLKAILTPDQYDQWMRWCAESSGAKL